MTVFNGDMFRDHPRLCGNDPILIVIIFPVSGSPPLVRERLAARTFEKRGRGITPACAGTTFESILTAI